MSDSAVAKPTGLLLPVVLFFAAFICLFALPAHGQTSREEVYARAAVTELWEPVPATVTTDARGVPSDALVLFAGEDLSQWQAVKGGPASWSVTPPTGDEPGYFTVVRGSGDIETAQSFTDVQLHIEWRAPAEVVGDSQGRGNSGVFLMRDYEVQVLDSFDNPTYSNGQAASVYKQHIPLVNASRPPGEWQSYDIIFRAPRFNPAGRMVVPATLTVLHNGVLVQNNVTLHGPTEFIGEPSYAAHGPLPIKLQDHGNPVSFRNIWVRRL